MFKLADSVLHRIVQIVQEAILTGLDCSDYMRQISLSLDKDDSHVLVLSEEYQKQVREMHEKMLSEVNAFKQEVKN